MTTTRGRSTSVYDQATARLERDDARRKTAQDEAKASRKKLERWIGAGVAALLVVIVGIALAVESCKGSGGGGVAGAQASGEPTPDQIRQEMQSKTVTIASPTDDRIVFGNRLPFPIPSIAGELEQDGGGLVRGNVKYPRATAGGSNFEFLANEDGMVWAVLKVDPSNKKSLLGRSVATAQRVLPPQLLLGDSGFVYAQGLVYEDSNQRLFILDPDIPIRGISLAPEMIPTRTDQRLYLLFKVPKGATINSFWLGARSKIVEWQPPVTAPQ
jgi:hypothetical protein